MDSKAATLILWASLIATLPVPYFMVDIGWMPTGWLLTIAALVSTSAVVDGLAGTWLIALLFILQALAYLAFLYLGTRLSMRVLKRIPVPRLRVALLSTLVLALWLAATQPIYWTDLVNVDPRMTIFDVFQ